MNYIQQIFACAALAFAGTAYQPAMAQVKLSSDAYPVIVAPHSQSISYLERTLCYDITSNVDYTVATDADWLSVRKAADGSVYIHVAYNESNFKRVGRVTFVNEEKGLKETLTITQSKNEGAAEIPSDDIFALFTDWD